MKKLEYDSGGWSYKNSFEHMMADDDDKDVPDVPLDPDLAAEALETDIDPDEDEEIGEGPLLDAFGAPIDE